MRWAALVVARQVGASGPSIAMPTPPDYPKGLPKFDWKEFDPSTHQPKTFEEWRNWEIALEKFLGQLSEQGPELANYHAFILAAAVAVMDSTGDWPHKKRTIAIYAKALEKCNQAAKKP